MYQQAVTFLEQGGAVVWILLSFSVFALTITLAKAIQLWQPQLLSGAANKAFALLAEGKRSEALLLVHGRRNPRCRLLSEALEVLEQDRIMLEFMDADANQRENLYQHDIGLVRLRRHLKSLAKEQLELIEAKQL